MAYLRRLFLSGSIAMHIFIAPDIFGHTQALDQFAEDLHLGLPPQITVSIVDPYSGRSTDFADEASAYQYFISTYGVANYAARLEARLAFKIKEDSEPKPAYGIGFSVGASAFWMLGNELEALGIEKLVCFYGSQIRKDTARRLSRSTELILPKSEVSFDVDHLAYEIKDKRNLILHRTEYLHGFMNKKSGNFNGAAYQRYLVFLHQDILTTFHAIDSQ